MAMDHATYCAKICGAKCCYLYKPHPIPCPQLAPDCSCSIYKQRFRKGSPSVMAVGHFLFKGETHPFLCGKIMDVIAAGLLPKAIEDQCCYAHPELLKTDLSSTVATEQHVEPHVDLRKRSKK